MYESDEARLNALRLQRQRVQELLAWLDREVADAEKAAGPTPTSPALAPLAAPVTTKPAAPESPAASIAEAEAMLEEYRQPARDLQRDVRRGCFLYFAGALLLTALVVVILYYALRHN